MNAKLIDKKETLYNFQKHMQPGIKLLKENVKDLYFESLRYKLLAVPKPEVSSNIFDESR